ncbi:hypothetical protein PR001_g26224 [Phytophthora rubi]|uniref:Uncharacterized protein n=1 Tax=Phytophthora rubi TaxID=129364 RepID=A0A6A3HSX2_9STRA|nr:hypothetical protein PR001_g26224 [Phytophthora rubi]
MRVLEKAGQAGGLLHYFALSEEQIAAKNEATSLKDSLGGTTATARLPDWYRPCSRTARARRCRTRTHRRGC